jgi:surface polysaccharide O-acyltransferase-like enzyme
LIEKVSNASFGVYLVHLLVIGILASDPFKSVFGFNIEAAWITPYIGLPLTIISVFIISYVITVIMKKLPVFKKFVP